MILVKMSSTEPLKNDLMSRLSQAPDLETELDEIRRFKKEKVAKIQEEDVTGKKPLPQVFFELSEVADALLNVVLQLAEKDLVKTFGFPTYVDNQGNLMRSQFSVIGMGKLGGKEIHYGSDLDLIFLYSRNGQTEGRKILTNREFYARLAQKLISYLSVYTREGLAYQVDTQLRPSGNQGTLVSSLDSYADYQRNMAAPWEKQALLKARPLAGDAPFQKSLGDQFKKFIFSTEFPANLNEDIHRLRRRMEKEIARENPRRIHYKQGFGGLTDIEFAGQYIQLKMGKIFDSIVTANTLNAIERMGERSILKPNEYDILKSGYLFYRLLETRMEVFFDLKEGYLDPESHLLENLSDAMGLASGHALLEKFNRTRQDVRRSY